MTVSVVACTWNKALQTKRGILSLINQTIPPTEIILVDDGSTDDTEIMSKVLRKEAKGRGITFKYVYLDHPEARISCYPRNVGFRNTTGDVIVFTEPEVLHVGDTITQLLKKMEENPDRTPVATQVWTIQRKIYDEIREDDFIFPARILTHPYAQLTDNVNLSNSKAPDSDWAITGSNNCLTGCLFAVQRKWFEDLGGFDESFTGHGVDDFNLFDRLALYGKGVLPCDDIVVIHQFHEKNYPYNIYDHAEKNGRKGEENMAKWGYRANVDTGWGLE